MFSLRGKLTTVQSVGASSLESKGWLLNSGNKEEIYHNLLSKVEPGNIESQQNNTKFQSPGLVPKVDIRQSTEYISFCPFSRAKKWHKLRKAYRIWPVATVTSINHNLDALKELSCRM